jgi:hypothetical protein
MTYCEKQYRAYLSHCAVTFAIQTLLLLPLLTVVKLYSRGTNTKFAAEVASVQSIVVSLSHTV